jgi:hypothetical protein
MTPASGACQPTREGGHATGKRVLEKRLRMTLDFEVKVEELTDETLRDYYSQFPGFDEKVADAAWADLSRQLRLQRALLEDDEALEKFLAYVVTNEVDSSLDSRLREAFGVGGERADEVILESIFSSLGHEDASYFRTAVESGTLFEAVESVSRSIRARWVGADIREVKVAARLATGDSE